MDYDDEMYDGFDENEIRAEDIIRKYGLIPTVDKRREIKELLEFEINNYIEGSSEYLRVLCGMLFCIGNIEDSVLIWKAKMINFDVGCMIDVDFIFGAGIKETLDYISDKQEFAKMRDFLESYDLDEPIDKEEIVKNYKEYYTGYFSL